MAWTGPRTWVTNELVTAALLNVHVRDNENYLYDQFDFVAGHDHDGADSMLLDWDLCWTDAVHAHSSAAEGGLLDWDTCWADAAHSHASAAEGGVLAWADLPTASFTTWISGAADSVQSTYLGTASRPHHNGYAEGPSADTIGMIFRFPVPYLWAGQVVHVKTIDVYYYTSAVGVYFDTIYLRRSDLDASVTDDVTYTTDLGNGTSGNATAQIYNGDLAMADFPYHIVIKCAGGGTYDNYRIYGIKVTWDVG